MSSQKASPEVFEKKDWHLCGLRTALSAPVPIHLPHDPITRLLLRPCFLVRTVVHERTARGKHRRNPVFLARALPLPLFRAPRIMYRNIVFRWCSLFSSVNPSSLSSSMSKCCNSQRVL